MQKKQKKPHPYEKKKQSKTDQEPTQMLELANKVIKTVIITAFYLSEN